MTKYYIIEDEEFPVYHIMSGKMFENTYRSFEIPQELVDKYEKAQTLWDEVQQELENIVRK